MAGWRDIFGAGGGGHGPLGIPSSGNNVQPGTGPGGIDAGQLEPNSRARNMEAGVPYQLVPAYPPFVRIANSPGIVYFPRFRTIVFGGNGVAAGTTTQQFQFSVPTIIIARTGGAFAPTGTALDVGKTALDLFKIQFSRAGSNSDLIDAGGGGATNPALNTLASAILGTGGLPGFIPGNGLFIDTGSFLNVTCQILLNSVEATVTIWCIEEYGPARG